MARIEDRPIFRPIQYVGSYLHQRPLEWLTRSIVTMSCLHVENSLKRRLKIDGPLSIGMILKRSNARSLDADLVGILRELNQAVYNKAKHSIEHTHADGHMFSIADSLAIYLICRTAGSRILKDSGITTKYDEPVFDKEIRAWLKQLCALAVLFSSPTRLRLVAMGVFSSAADRTSGTASDKFAIQSC